MKLSDIDVSSYDTLLLDRDGVINRLRPNDYVKCWEEFEFLPGVLDMIAKMEQGSKAYFHCYQSTWRWQGINDRKEFARYSPTHVP